MANHVQKKFKHSLLDDCREHGFSLTTKLNEHLPCDVKIHFAKYGFYLFSKSTQFTPTEIKTKKILPCLQLIFKFPNLVYMFYFIDN